MCNVCGPGEPPQPARFFLLWSWQMCRSLWKEYHVVIDSFGRSEVHSKTILCELYVVKFWEGMV